MLGPVLGFGVFAAVIVGVMYGPLVFLGLLGSLIGGLALIAEKKVGRSLQFGDYSFWKRSLAQAAAFGLALGVIFFLVFLSKFRPF